MFIRPCYRRKNGKRHAYWALMESYRTERGPRQRIVAYLGQLDESHRLGVKNAAEGNPEARQKQLFDDTRPHWVEVDVKRMRVENRRDFGGPWLGLQLVEQLGLKDFLDRTIPDGREEIPWSLMAVVLILCRLCEPSSELHIAEHVYAQSALIDLLGIAPEKINEQRLYRALDAILPHKEALEAFLKNRLGELFGIEYDLLLYDVTSTYFEGQAAGNPLAQRGYSRDHRPDCKQVCIGLVVSKCGMPLGYEVFAGNRVDVTTLQEIVQTMERRYGRADRIWVGDRGMVSADNIAFLKRSGRRYIVGTPKSMLKQFERELLAEDCARFVTAWKSNCVRRRMATRPSCFAAAAIAARKKRPCTAVSSGGSRKACSESRPLVKNNVNRRWSSRSGWDACLGKTVGRRACFRRR